jgi:uncharacterized protein (DUF885 family)
MYRYALGAMLAIASWQLEGCSNRAQPVAQHPGAPPAPREQLARMVQRYWDAYAALNPLRAAAAGEHRYDDRLGDPISPQYLADSLALERAFLAEARALTAPAEPDDRITYEMFERRRELAIEGFTYPSELMPVNPFEGMPLEFASLAEGAGEQRFASPKDFADWLSRVDDYVAWTRQAVANLRDGVRRGYVQPRELVEEEIAQLRELGEDRPDNPFYGPQRSIPASLSPQARVELAARLDAAIKRKILPAYRELHDYLQVDYLPVARAGGSLADLPLGEAWYAYRVRVETGTQLGPAEINRIGMTEIERLHGRMAALLNEAGYVGDAQSFFDSMRQDPRFAHASVDELLGAFRDVQEKVAAAVKNVLLSPPQVPVEVRPTESYRAMTDAAFRYQGINPDGGAKSILFVDGYDLAARAGFAVEPQFLDGAVPGQHAQFLAQRAQKGLPKFRRFGTEPAYAEGWGLYAESLGEDLGLYREPAVRFAVLLSDLRASVALVVDTGLHARRWSRRQALDFMHSEMPIDEREAGLIVDRSCALPGRQLAAKLGELRLAALRDRARLALGPRFDLAAFHREILVAGAMPLDLLQQRMEAWISGVAKQPPDDVTAAASAAAPEPESGESPVANGASAASVAAP